MLVTNKVRMQRLFQHGKCLDVAIDHGIAILIGLENIEGVMDNLIAARHWETGV